MDWLAYPIVFTVVIALIWVAERLASKRRKPHGKREPLARQHWYKADDWFSEAKSFLRPPPR